MQGDFLSLNCPSCTIGLASIGVLDLSIRQRGPRRTLVALEATIPRSLPVSFPGRVGQWEIAESQYTWEESHRVVTFVRDSLHILAE